MSGQRGQAVLAVLAGVVVFLLARQAVVVLGDQPSYILPGPFEVLERWAAAWRDGILQPHLAATLAEILLGLLAGGLAGIAVGYLSAITATNPDLSGFRQAGGKLSMYHGWNDPNIPAMNTINYYQSVLDKMKELDDFFRLFLVPGMGHCSGGPGTDQFAALQALEQWVEKGVAPQSIPASHVEKGAVTMTRPLCPYPRQAVYNGTGDPNNIGSFKCQ